MFSVVFSSFLLSFFSYFLICYSFFAPSFLLPFLVLSLLRLSFFLSSILLHSFPLFFLSSIILSFVFSFILPLFFSSFLVLSSVFLSFFYSSLLSVFHFFLVCSPNSLSASSFLSVPISSPHTHTHMLLITAHINIKGLTRFHPNSAAGNVRGVHCYRGRFIREVSVCSLKLILYQKSSLPLATRLIKLRPALMKSDCVTLYTPTCGVHPLTDSHLASCL